VKDFAWWASLTASEAKRALQLVADRLRSVQVDGVEYWQLHDAPPASSGPVPVLLLPVFDEYTVAYADRTVALDESLLRSLSHGLAANVVINGRIAGTWKRTFRGDDAVAITPTFLRILNRQEQSGFLRAAERYAGFLGRTLENDGVRPPRTSTQKGKRQR